MTTHKLTLRLTDRDLAEMDSAAIAIAGKAGAAYIGRTSVIRHAIRAVACGRTQAGKEATR